MPVKTGNGLTLLEVHLITGRSHQIRAHLASIGHPIAGDTKYGDSHLNQRLRDRYGLRYQLAAFLPDGAAFHGWSAGQFVRKDIYRASAGLFSEDPER